MLNGWLKKVLRAVKMGLTELLSFSLIRSSKHPSFCEALSIKLTRDMYPTYLYKSLHTNSQLDTKLCETFKHLYSYSMVSIHFKTCLKKKILNTQRFIFSNFHFLLLSWRLVQIFNQSMCELLRIHQTWTSEKKLPTNASLQVISFPSLTN